MNFEKKFDIIRTFVAVVISLILGFVIILMVSKEPISTIYYFVVANAMKIMVNVLILIVIRWIYKIKKEK